jgi:hypothetical protein
MYVFAYGSLMCPASLLGSLPDVALDECVPARCAGFTRTFDVAFPNDGSQPDKAYFDERGGRPEHVLFANLADDGGVANGVCVPVREEDLGVLHDRERRYELVDVSDRVVGYPGVPGPAGEVLAFLGRAEFRALERAATGVVPRSYAAAVESGAMYWDGRVPGFFDDYAASTRPGPLATLARVDYL